MGGLSLIDLIRATIPFEERTRCRWNTPIEDDTLDGIARARFLRQAYSKAQRGRA